MKCSNSVMKQDIHWENGQEWTFFWEMIGLGKVVEHSDTKVMGFDS